MPFVSNYVPNKPGNFHLQHSQSDWINELVRKQGPVFLIVGSRPVINMNKCLILQRSTLLLECAKNIGFGQGFERHKQKYAPAPLLPDSRHVPANKT